MTYLYKLLNLNYNHFLPNTSHFQIICYGLATNYLGVGIWVVLLVSTHILKQTNSRCSGPQLIRGQLYSHSECIINVYTQLGAQHSHRGSYRNFSTSKYVEEVIVGDELDEGNLSLAAGAGEDKS